MNIHRQLSQIVTTTREYIEEQMQLGFFDMDEETKNTEIPQTNNEQKNTRKPALSEIRGIRPYLHLKNRKTPVKTI